MARALVVAAAMVLSCPVFAGCRAQTAAPQSAQQPVTVAGTQWSPVQKNVNPSKGRDYTVEFLPPGQTTDQWTQMLTVQFFAIPEGLPGDAERQAKEITAQSFAEKFISRLGKVSTRTLESNPNEVMLAWSGRVALPTKRKDVPPVYTNESEIDKITREPKGLRVIRYTSAQVLNESETAQWQTALNQLKADQLVPTGTH